MKEKKFIYQSDLEDTSMQDFFTKGWCRFTLGGLNAMTFDDLKGTFKNSTLYEYLEFYFGELVLTKNSGLNFIDVVPDCGDWLLFDAILSEQKPPEYATFQIIPKALDQNYDTKRFDPTNFGRIIHEEGVTCFKNFSKISNMPRELKAIVEEAPFVEQDDECCPDFVQARNHSNDFLNGSPYPEGDALSNFVFEFLNKRFFKGNTLFQTATNRTLRLNRTRKGHLLEPHVDVNQSCYLAAIYYTTNHGDIVEGREFEVYTQDPQDELERMRSYLTEDDYLYRRKDYLLRTTQRIPIEDDLLIVINNYNPKFVHGHPPQITDCSVHSIVMQNGHPEVPANNKLNILKTLGNYV